MKVGERTKEEIEIKREREREREANRYGGKGRNRVKESGRNPLTSAVFIPLLCPLPLSLSLSPSRFRSRSPAVSRPSLSSVFLSSFFFPFSFFFFSFFSFLLSERAPTSTIDRSLPIPGAGRDGADPAESRKIIMRERKETSKARVLVAAVCVYRSRRHPTPRLLVRECLGNSLGAL